MLRLTRSKNVVKISQQRCAVRARSVSKTLQERIRNTIRNVVETLKERHPYKHQPWHIFVCFVIQIISRRYCVKFKSPCPLYIKGSIKNKAREGRKGGDGGAPAFAATSEVRH